MESGQQNTLTDDDESLAEEEDSSSFGSNAIINMDQVMAELQLKSARETREANNAKWFLQDLSTDMTIFENELSTLSQSAKLRKLEEIKEIFADYYSQFIYAHEDLQPLSQQLARLENAILSSESNTEQAALEGEPSSDTSAMLIEPDNGPNNMSVGNSSFSLFAEIAQADDKEIKKEEPILDSFSWISTK